MRLDGLANKTYRCRNGKELLACQRAKVGRFKLTDFFVPLTGFFSRSDVA
jgi:hypothetical protein